MTIPIKYLRQLGELIASGHRRFGKVAPRRPYREEEESGEGTIGQLLFEQHPLLANIPQGASSDLTFITQDNKYSSDEAEKRSDEASLQLKKKLDLKLDLGKKHITTPTPNPYVKGG